MNAVGYQGIAIRRDLAFAARSLCKNPAFAITALVTLALDIAVSTAIL
jgi:hypothetical protein